MKLIITENYLEVEREEGDPKFYASRSSWGSAESRLLYHIKQRLVAMGYDFIKKRMWRDGHLTDESQQYLRARTPKAVKVGEIWAVYFGSYMVLDAAHEFNRGAKVLYNVERG